MILRTWCGSHVDTAEYRGIRIYGRVALGWIRHLVGKFGRPNSEARP